MLDLIKFLPLISPVFLAVVFLLSLFCPGLRPKPVKWASLAAVWVSLLVSIVFALSVYFYGNQTITIVDGFINGFSIRFDALSATMFGLISLMGLMVVVYSQNYLDGDSRQGQFLGSLCLTLASVSMLVLAGHLFQFVLCWIGTSLALHTLLLFYKNRPAAVLAAQKKFVVARLGDLCLIAATVLIANFFGTTDMGQIFQIARHLTSESIPYQIHLAGVLLAIAAALKSAQFPAHGWLLEVMETPTPVSALLHAGILNAGIFLIVRFSDVVRLCPEASYFLIIIGGFTALFASSVMLTQSSIKVSLAYSSAAHMGFMLMQCGFGIYPLAIAHLVGHSFYKAHAFLSAGSVVDISRKSPSVSADQKQNILPVLISLVVAVGIFFFVGKLFGMSSFKEPAVFVMGIIFVLGLAHLLLQSYGKKNDFILIAKIFRIAVAVSLSFFCLEMLSKTIFSGLLPSISEPNSITIALMCVVVLLFSMVVLAQFFMKQNRYKNFWKIAYVATKNGLYTNDLFSVLVGCLFNQKNKNLKPKANRDISFEASSAAKPSFESKVFVLEAAMRAGKRISPVWPLKSFVAVNPFLGFTQSHFSDTPDLMAKECGARVLMPNSFYAEAIKQGLIKDEDLSGALASTSSLGSTSKMIQELKDVASSHNEPQIQAHPTIADLATRFSQNNWCAISTNKISAWASDYFDQGQASWQSPWQSSSPYQAWLNEASLDWAPELMGLKGFRSLVKSLPVGHEEAMTILVGRLGIAQDALENYFHRLFMSVGGWSAYTRFLLWQKELYGQTDDVMIQFLTIRLVWEVALLELLSANGVAEAWEEVCVRYLPDNFLPKERNQSFTSQYLLQSAYEKSWQRNFISKVSNSKGVISDSRRSIQAAFCIDVRSEVFRRHFESLDQQIETIGFAGFFGLPVEYLRLGFTQGVSQCPVLLTSKNTIVETLGANVSPDEKKRLVDSFLRRIKAAKLWKSFKMSAVSCFAFVGPVGMLYLPRLILDSLGFSRHPKKINAKTGPTTESRVINGRITGYSAEEKIVVAEQILKGMSLTSGFARLVLLAGHGSTTVNNPHATGLDCGACGGNAGDVNARIAAEILNDSQVRAKLGQKGICLPSDTFFLGGLHDTTTDEVTILDEDNIPSSHASDVKKLKQFLVSAAEKTRAERSRLLGIKFDSKTQDKVLRRSRDWSQTRPEWGLAGCAAFVAAPRSRTAGADLQGRVFLHSYDWKKDERFDVLELIMTAPMIVASWINLQYYGSTVDNKVWGSGNKTLHNVVGTIGVLEGNGGDLRVGLPWQSVCDGEKLIHEPLRLSVVIEAPTEAINGVIKKHEFLRSLLDNEWLHLFAMDEKGNISKQYAGRCSWNSVFSTSTLQGKR